MAASVGFKVEGLSALVRDLQALGLDVEDLKGAFSAIAAEGAQVMEGFIPVRSGRLRGDVRGNRARSKAVVTVGRASIPYAGPIQWGWGELATHYKHGKYATGIRGRFTGVGFFAKTDAVMDPRAIGLLEAEINKRIAARDLS